MSLIVELANEILRVSREHHKTKQQRPNLIVYVNRMMYVELRSARFGAVSSAAYEFYEHNTVLGYTVYTVADECGKTHPPWKVVTW